MKKLFYIIKSFFKILSRFVKSVGVFLVNFLDEGSKQNRIYKKFLGGAFIFLFVMASVFVVKAGSRTPQDNALFAIQPAGSPGAPNASKSTGLFGSAPGALENIIVGTRYDDVANIIYNNGLSDSQKQEQLSALINQNRGGAIGFTYTLSTSMLQQRSASAVQDLSNKIYAIQNFGKVAAQSTEPVTYYPGTGYDLLKPIQSFWSYAQNLVFSFLIILIILFAFAIMFRSKLSGGTVVTLQNAIPSIAMALILVPLSYNICGLFIDGITLGTNAVHDFLLGSSGPGYTVYKNRTTGNNTECFGTNVFTGVSVTTEDRGYYADDCRVDWLRIRDRINITKQANDIAQSVFDNAGPLQGVLQIVNAILNVFAGNGDSREVAWFGTFVNLFLSLCTLYIGFKIFQKLFGKFIIMIMLPTISPFVFATVAVPGNGTKSVVEYLKTLGSVTLSYIVTYAMFLLTMIFTDPAFQSTIPDFKANGFIPPLLGLNSILEVTGTGAAGFGSIQKIVLTLIGLGIYFSIPSALENVDAALGVKNAIPKMLTIPFQSFMESARFTARTAPAFAARTGRTLLGGVNRSTGAFYGARATLRDSADRLRGIRRGSGEDWRTQRAGQIADQLSEAQQAFAIADSTNNEAGRIAAQLRINALQAQAQREGVDLAAFKGKLTAVVKSRVNNGSPDNTILFSATSIDDFIAEYLNAVNRGVPEPMRPRREYEATIEIKSEEYQIPINSGLLISVPTDANAQSAIGGSIWNPNPNRVPGYGFPPGAGPYLMHAFSPGTGPDFDPFFRAFTGMGPLGLRGANLEILLNNDTSLKQVAPPGLNTLLIPNNARNQLEIRFRITVTDPILFFGKPRVGIAQNGADLARAVPVGVETAGKFFSGGELSESSTAGRGARRSAPLLFRMARIAPNGNPRGNVTPIPVSTSAPLTLQLKIDYNS